ncbi:hypothetical protein FNH13_16410 [Ornithinimicrobium ciconiae]|uniref:Uncharacterized protein n=1 Tax=Ornithinimicrobium ciconiae TaxID=2594265 RepID=A0A516GDW2_9MICO|nr:hypothetical protein [Ornithinimicrobium ciconiae]QDO89722.1 hypothetical protein FNH13_16410 [Ornithinimicrobium ciconiae]
MKRVATAIVAGAAVASLAYASASVLTVNAKPLQAGGDSVTCQEADNPVEVVWGLETGSNSVGSVTVKNIAEACWDSGAKVFVAIDGVPVLSGGNSPLITGASHTLAFPSPRAPESINDVRVYFG